MAKLIGIILMIIGIIVAALSFSQVRSMVPITLPAQLTDTYLIVIGVVILLIGAFMMRGSGGSTKNAGKELPIYKGNQIIGYRKM